MNPAWAQAAHSQIINQDVQELGKKEYQLMKYWMNCSCFYFFFLLQFTCGSSVNDFNILAKSDAGAAKSDTTCRKKKERKLRKIDTIYKKRNTFNKFQDLQLEQSSKQPHKPVVHWPCAPETGVPVVAGYCWACCWNIFGDFPLASWAIFKFSENKRKEN